MDEARLEKVAGIAVLALTVALAIWVLGPEVAESAGSDDYRVTAVFDTVGGLEPGAAVEIAGVPVGTVRGVRLTRDEDARVTLRISASVALPADSVVAIDSRGLVGQKHVRITPGTSARFVRDGGELRHTKDPVELDDLIAQAIHGKI